MFTGIIEELGSVESLDPRPSGARLRVRCRTVLEDIVEGASISVNGVCLTVTDIRGESFSADVAPETLRRSNLGDLKARSLVNLERPLSPGGRLGGHIVQGHVDGTGKFVALDAVGADNWWIKVRAPRDLDRYLVFKGSIAIDGISLTIAVIEDDVLAVSLIPHSYRNTNLHTRKPGDRLNLECDILAKYVEKLLAARDTPRLTVDKLREMGY